MRRRRSSAWAEAAVLGGWLAACSHAAPNATPEGAVRAWLDHMEASMGDPSEAKEAYALLGPRTKRNLETRAERAGKAEGRRAQAFEMLAEGRFGLKFRPKSLRATVAGEDATVDVTGDDPATEHAKVACVREADGWHVEADLPEVLAPQRTHDGG